MKKMIGKLILQAKKQLKKNKSVYAVLRRFNNPSLTETKIRKHAQELILAERTKIAPNEKAQPVATLIEITNTCNLNCVMCNTKLQKRSSGFMNQDTFHLVLHELKSVGIDTISLHTVGETFMHKKVNDLIGIALSSGFNVWISTNGQFPDKLRETLTLFPQILNVRFSIDGGTKKTYEKIRRGGSFEILLNSLEVVDALNQGRIDSRVVMSIDSILSMDNIHELPDYFRLYGKYCSLDSIHFNLVNGLSPDSTYFNEWPLRNIVTSSVPCQLPFNAVYFTYGGKVTLCCRDYDEELVVGNLNDDRLSAIWMGDKARAVRSMHTGQAEMMINCCKRCEMPHPLVNGLADLYIHYLRIRDRERAMDGERFGKDILAMLGDIDQALVNGFDVSYVERVAARYFSF